jgi:acetate kinase
VRRYGFHGLSYEYIASVLPTQDGGAKFERTVVAHLGNGASMCALRDFKSVATTMGLTPMDVWPWEHVVDPSTLESCSTS